ncbi:MAG TPA: SRPBCC family protein [Steroidobacteraceae bacterium]
MPKPIVPIPTGLAADERAEEFVDTVRIARPRHELYAFWRHFSNLPRFMEKVRKVTEVDSLSSIWTVAGTAGSSADWEFIVTDDEVDRLIAWSASGNTPIKYSGRVEFRDAAPDPAPPYSADAIPGADETPDCAATEVTATLRYEAASGLIDGLIARMSGATAGADDPAVQTRSDLLRFKEVMEGSGTAQSARGGRPRAPAPS